MKVFLVLWLIIGGHDVGGPPVEVASMQECEARATKMRAIGIPDGAELMRVGCVTEIKAGSQQKVQHPDGS